MSLVKESSYFINVVAMVSIIMRIGHSWEEEECVWEGRGGEMGKESMKLVFLQ